VVLGARRASVPAQVWVSVIANHPNWENFVLSNETAMKRKEDLSTNQSADFDNFFPFSRRLPFLVTAPTKPAQNDAEHGCCRREF
jgi:hypothetical protein